MSVMHVLDAYLGAGLMLTCMFCVVLRTINNRAEELYWGTALLDCGCELLDGGLGGRAIWAI